MTSQQKDDIGGVLILEQYSKNQPIVIEGDQASSFYIIKEVLYFIFLKSTFNNESY